MQTTEEKKREALLDQEFPPGTRTRIQKFAIENRAIMDAVFGLLESAKEPRDPISSTLPAQRIHLRGGAEQLALLKAFVTDNGLKFRDQPTGGTDGPQVTIELPSHRLQLVVSYSLS